MTKKDVLQSTKGYRLAKSVRDMLAGQYSLHPITVVTRAELMKLPGLVPSVEEREFLADVLVRLVRRRGAGKSLAAPQLTVQRIVIHVA